MNSQEAGSAIFEKRCGTFGVKKHWNGPELELNFKVILTSTFEIFSQRSDDAFKSIQNHLFTKMIYIFKIHPV